MKRHLFLLSLVTIPLVLSGLMPAGAAAGEAAEASRVRLNINPGWKFHLGEPAVAPVGGDYDDAGWELVSLPHSHRIFPADLSGFTEHGREVGWYRREIRMPDDWSGRRIFIEFQGAMQTTKVWVNGKEAGEYADGGYDSFHFDLTEKLKPGSNSLVVRVDNLVNPDIAPDGQKTDFIQFGGLYRDVHLVVTGPQHVTFPWESREAGVRLTLPEVSAGQAVVKVETQVANASKEQSACELVTEIRDDAGKVVAAAREKAVIPAGGARLFVQTCPAIRNPRLWSPDSPYLYRVHSIVLRDGKESDRVVTRLGVRWVKWDKKEGFFLNGKHLKLVGANRHQTWPFIGNAVPNSLHRRDAEQMKEMGCNWVRCSHYPHDPDFLDALDELGLLALEEGPTWMKRGGEKWMASLEKSFRAMIRRDRNHPSIIIWNACINHGRAEKMLVKAATEEDPTRARGQDNVPCPMNFKHKTISGGGALCIEHTGHTFATFRGDVGKPGKAEVGWVYGQETDNREYEQARRHYEHTDAAYKVPGNAGLAVWCMYDYNTFHNATGAIAPHGVLDLFRIPKHSWWWHQSELTAKPVVHVVRINATDVCVFSNCEKVRLLQSSGTGAPVAETRAPDSGFSLRHPPFHFKVSPDTTIMKAEGLRGGAVQATSIWRKPGKAAKLLIEADRASIIADGSDINRILVSAVDANGTPVTDETRPVTFALEGDGQLVGENPVKLRAGKMIILAQASFAAGKIRVRATADGLEPAETSFATTAVGPGVDLPASLTSKHPSSERLLVRGGTGGKATRQAMDFEPKRDVPPDSWIESDPIMLDSSSPVAITGGEYRIYTSNWTNKPGKAGGGDAIFVRVKSSAAPGGKSTAELTLGSLKIPFTVTTRP